MALTKVKEKQNGVKEKEFIRIDNKNTNIPSNDDSIIIIDYKRLILLCIDYHVQMELVKMQLKNDRGWDWNYHEEIIRLQEYFESDNDYFEVPLLDARKLKDMVETAKLQFMHKDALTFRYYIKNLEVK